VCVCACTNGGTQFGRYLDKSVGSPMCVCIRVSVSSCVCVRVYIWRKSVRTSP